jgi:hypothetical protein
MIGLLLFIVAGLVIGWAVNHPAAWAVLLIPIAFALLAGDDVDIVVAILGIALTALAVLAGRMLARRLPPDEIGESDEAQERDEVEDRDERDEVDDAGETDERDKRSG